MMAAEDNILCYGLVRFYICIRGYGAKRGSSRVFQVPTKVDGVRCRHLGSIDQPPNLTLTPPESDSPPSERQTTCRCVGMLALTDSAGTDLAAGQSGQ